MKDQTVRADTQTGGQTGGTDLLQDAQFPLAAAITAGGQSRRFGQDKALYAIGGVTLLQRVAASLRACEPRVLVAPPGKYTVSGWQNVSDLRPGEGHWPGWRRHLRRCNNRVVPGWPTRRSIFRT